AFQRTAILLRKTDADGVSAIIDNHRRSCRGALKNSFSIGNDFIGSETGSRGYGWIDIEGNSGAAHAVFDSVQHIHHAFNLANGIRNPWRIVAQHCRILRKELHFDRLGSATEIIDHVLQELDELDINSRLLLLDLRANFGDNFLDIPIALSV